MSERDGQPTRRARARGRQRTLQQSQSDDVEEAQPFGSPVRIAPRRASTSSFMPPPSYDPRWTLPSFDQHIPTGNPDTTFSTPHLGDPSVSGTIDPAFFQTYARTMPFNANLFLSLVGSGQQPQSTQQQSQPFDLPCTGHLLDSDPNPSQPPHSQPTRPPTGNTSKILLEPEGDTLVYLWFEVLLC